MGEVVVAVATAGDGVVGTVVGMLVGGVESIRSGGGKKENKLFWFWHGR